MPLFTHFETLLPRAQQSEASKPMFDLLTAVLRAILAFLPWRAWRTPTTSHHHAHVRCQVTTQASLGIRIQDLQFQTTRHHPRAITAAIIALRTHFWKASSTWVDSDSDPTRYYVARFELRLYDPCHCRPLFLDEGRQ